MNDQTALMQLVTTLFPVNLSQMDVTFANPLEIRGKIESLEQAVLALPGGHTKIKTTHRFAKGLYCREVFIPKGCLVIGKIHRHECVSLMSMGDKTVLTEDGVRRLKAPFTGISRPGIKRIGFAHEDSIWITVHATDERDLQKLDDELTAKTYSDVEVKDLDLVTLFTEEGLCPS